ncbi:unnamed protein product, partial [Prorocentrum cordatum]
MLYKQFDLEIVYEMGGGNMFEVETLQRIAKFEQDLRSLPLWSGLCAESYVLELPYCELGVSFANYALPSLAGASSTDIVPSDLSFDGKGEDLIPVATVFQMLKEHDVTNVVLPSSYSTTMLDSGSPAPMSLLRSAFRWKVECCRPTDSQAHQSKMLGEIREKWQKFISEELLPAINEQSVHIGEDIRVFYDGDHILRTEVMTTLIRDMNLATGSFLFVFLYIWFHTSSIVLSLVIGASVPLSYVVFAALTGQRTMTLASFLAVFLVVPGAARVEKEGK